MVYARIYKRFIYIPSKCFVIQRIYLCTCSIRAVVCLYYTWEKKRKIFMYASSLQGYILMIWTFPCIFVCTIPANIGSPNACLYTYTFSHNITTYTIILTKCGLNSDFDTQLYFLRIISINMKLSRPYAR